MPTGIRWPELDVASGIKNAADVGRWQSGSVLHIATWFKIDLRGKSRIAAGQPSSGAQKPQTSGGTFDRSGYRSDPGGARLVGIDILPELNPIFLNVVFMIHVVRKDGVNLLAIVPSPPAIGFPT